MNFHVFMKAALHSIINAQRFSKLVLHSQHYEREKRERRKIVSDREREKVKMCSIQPVDYYERTEITLRRN